MTSQIFIGRDGKQYGPYTPEEINGMVRTGLVGLDDLVWYEGIGDWKPVRLLTNAHATNERIATKKLTGSATRESMEVAGLPKQTAEQPNPITDVDESKTQVESENQQSGKSLSSMLVLLGIALALAYVGGWHVAWGDNLLSTSHAGLYFDLSHGAAIRFNGLYYGLTFFRRFFDAPFISWSCLVVSWTFVGEAFR